MLGTSVTWLTALASMQAISSAGLKLGSTTLAATTMVCVSRLPADARW